MKSFAETEKINFFLGHSCNLKCRYNAEKQNKPEVIPMALKKQTVEFLQTIADAQPRKEKEQRKLNIHFVGGEPLIYFPVIEEVLSQVNRPNIEWSIETNGFLLTPKIVEYLNSKNVTVKLAHDGLFTEKAQGVDVFKDEGTLKMAKAINYLEITPTITAYSQDLYVVHDYLNELFEREITFKPKFLKLRENLPEDLIDYNLKHWLDTCERMRENAYNEFKSQVGGWESAYYSPYLLNYFNFSDGTNTLCTCCTRGKTLTIDPIGRIWRCIHGLFKVGSTQSTCKAIDERSDANIIHLYQENKFFCVNNCRWYPFCRGGCPRTPSTDSTKKHCEFLGVFFKTAESLIHGQKGNAL